MQVAGADLDHLYVGCEQLEGGALEPSLGEELGLPRVGEPVEKCP